MSKSQHAETALRCSFCNKSSAEIKKLIAGPKVFICDECVEVCNDIIADDGRFERRAPHGSRPAGQQPSSYDESETVSWGPDNESTFKCPSCGHQWKLR